MKRNQPYVTIASRDPEMLAHLARIVEWIAATPEGNAALRKAYDLHKGPLHIEANNDFELIGYTNYENINAIQVSSERVAHMSPAGQNGDPITPYSLERYIAHELFHATEKGFDVALYHLNMLRVDLVSQYMPKEILGFLSAHMHRFKAAKSSPEKIRTLLHDAYYPYFAPYLPEVEAKLLSRFFSDPAVMFYINQIETPAIQFENTMARYLGEPLRAAHTIRSTLYNDIHQAFGKENFTLALLQNFTSEPLLSSPAVGRGS